MRPGSIEELNERYMPKPDDPLYSWVRQMFPCPFIVVLDHNSDDDEEEESTWYPPPSERPKKPLPKNFGRNHRSPVKNETAQGVETPSPEEHHTISCAPAVRGKSLEVRNLLRFSMSHSKFRCRNSRWPQENLPSQ